MYSKNKKKTEKTMLYGGSERGTENQSFRAGHRASKKYAIYLVTLTAELQLFAVFKT